VAAMLLTSPFLQSTSPLTAPWATHYPTRLRSPRGQKSRYSGARLQLLGARSFSCGPPAVTSRRAPRAGVGNIRST